MNQRQWVYWHVIRNLGPMTNRELWEHVFGGNRPRSHTKVALGFLPNDVGQDTGKMRDLGYLENLNPPRRRGRKPLYKAI